LERTVSEHLFNNAGFNFPMATISECPDQQDRKNKRSHAMR